MKITNKMNLPESVVQAVRADPYDKGESRFSVTELLNPPIIRLLRTRHWDELEEDASDRIWALWGSIGHGVLERAASVDGNMEFVEKRLTIERLGVKVSGQIDLCTMKDDFTQTITDFKTTSVYSVLDKPHGKPEWEQQLNLYAHICREHGIQVDNLEIIALLRDWRPSELKKKPGYPEKSVLAIEIPMWDNDRAEKFLMARLQAHLEADSFQQAPVCSPEERWERPPRWAIMKPGQQRAVKLYDSYGEAQSARKEQQYVEKRPGEAIRCQSYCSVSRFCEYGRRFTDLEAAFDAD